jgi:hypothetical protein
MANLTINLIRIGFLAGIIFLCVFMLDLIMEDKGKWETVSLPATKTSIPDGIVEEADKVSEFFQEPETVPVKESFEEKKNETEIEKSASKKNEASISPVDPEVPAKEPITDPQTIIDELNQAKQNLSDKVAIKPESQSHSSGKSIKEEWIEEDIPDNESKPFVSRHDQIAVIFEHLKTASKNIR